MSLSASYLRQLAFLPDVLGQIVCNKKYSLSASVSGRLFCVVLSVVRWNPYSWFNLSNNVHFVEYVVIILVGQLRNFWANSFRFFVIFNPH